MVYIQAKVQKRTSGLHSLLDVYVCFVGRLSEKREPATFHEMLNF